jgi:hypothetical protein
MKKLIITLCSFGLLLGVAQAQPMGPNDPGFSGPPADMPAGPPEGRPQLPPDFEMPEEVVALHEEVRMLRDAIRDSREAALAALGDDATVEERIVAMTLWREDNAASIEEMRALSQELWELIRENRPDGRWAEIPEVILALREELKDSRIALAESRRDAILALGENPTDEAVREAIDAWREANVDALADAQALAMELRDWFRENRPERPVRPNTPGMAQRRAEFRDNVAAMRQNRRELAGQMANPELTPEQRQELIQAFREDQRELLQERKALKRQERIDQGGVGGDRRPGG